MADSRQLSKFVLSFESSKYTNHRSDRGGPTKYGITLATWKKVGYDKNGDRAITAEDIKLLTEGDYNRVFKLNYWDACWGDHIKNQSVANLLVDFAYNSGVSRAVRYIQGCVGTKQDGVMGPATISAINNYRKGQWVLFDALKVKRIAYFHQIVKNDPSQEVNLNGWLRRVKNIQYGKLIANNGKVIA